MSRLVFVTGAAGVLGARLLPGLEAAGWRTRALVHRRPVPGADEQVSGSITDVTALSTGSTGADAVLHLAALTHARRDSHYHAVNVEGTARALAAAKEAGVTRFVHVSTRAISPAGGGYSRSKLKAEELVRHSGIEHVIVRLPEVYGAGGPEGVDQMLARALRGATIPVVGEGEDVLCPVYVDDVLGVLIASLSSSRAIWKTYTLAGDCRPTREVAHACVRATASSSRVVGVPLNLVRAAGIAARVLPLPLFPDQLARLRAEKPAATPEAHEDLGFTPRSLDDGLRDAAQAGA
jgi:nucleoside-diphosphate-sugar epimerase